MNAAFDGIRVLDLAPAACGYCAGLLAGMGAEVIKIEPPGGEIGRHTAPFYQGEPGPERSLFFFHFNHDKKSITLDLETVDGRELFRTLCRRADVLVEAAAPGYMHGLGIGYPELSEANPRLVYVAITPFGQEGPRVGWKASDFTVQALGGVLYLNGEAGSAPVALGAFQASHAASAYAAAAAALALYDREETGEGQLIDVSMQECVVLGQQEALPSYQTWGTVKTRRNRNQLAPGFGIYQARDGFIFSQFIGNVWQRVVEWVNEQGLGLELRDERWADPEFRSAPDNHDRFDLIYGGFCQHFTREELFLEGQRRGIAIAPVQDVADLLRDPQLAYRRFFTPIPHPDLGTALTYPGPPFRPSATPFRVGHPAPRLGQHNDEVYHGELGLSAREVAALRARRVI